MFVVSPGRVYETFIKPFWLVGLPSERRKGFFYTLKFSWNMKFLEKDLEEIIHTADKSELCDRGLWAFGKMKRQLRIGNYGICDLITINRPYYHPGVGSFRGTITIFELKQEKVTMSSFLQAVRYVKGVKRFIKKHKPNLQDQFNFEIVLIGKSICSNSDICYLPELFSQSTFDRDVSSEEITSVLFYTYKYGIDGLHFEDQNGNFYLVNEGF